MSQRPVAWTVAGSTSGARYRQASTQPNLRQVLARLPTYTNEPGLTNALTELWYSFQSGPARVFVMDVRTERSLRGQPPRMVSVRQLQALRSWMRANKAALKRVVTAVPFFPDLKLAGWALGERKSTSRPDFRAYSIISSAFHPPPLTPPDFLFESPGLLDGQSDYVVTRHGGYTARSNFTRLSWREPTLRVAVYERKGRRLHDTALNLDG